MPQKNTFSAIICEFDPLHFGHRLLLEKAGEGGAPVVCVMSGAFMQRGTPSMLDKWTRARVALLNGADLVIELPITWACAGAERFASGGIALAAALGRGRLFFGSEVPDVPLLRRAAEVLLSEEFSRALSECPPDLSFAARRQLAAQKLLGPAAGEVLRQPNANLGVEYIKAIISQGADLTPAAVKREGAGHGQEGSGGGFMSASGIRKLTLEGGDLTGLAPESTAAALEAARREGLCAHISCLERPILCKLRSMSLEEFSLLPDLSEGLEHRLYRAAREARTLEELYALIKNKRVSHARVRRLAMYAFLGIKKPLPDTPPYLRVLGGTQRGWRALGELSPALPVVVRSRDVEALSSDAKETFRLEVLAGDLYALSAPTPQPAGRDYTQRPVKL